MRVYLAGPFFNPEQIATIAAIEKQLDKERVKYFSPRSEGTLQDMEIEDQSTMRKRIFDSNIDHMNACTHMLAVVGQKDTGTSFELGYFYAVGKPITLFSEDLSKINVMLAESANSICCNMETLYKCLTGEHTENITEVF